MTQATPFHPRTSSLCKSMLWKDWGGYYSVLSYENQHDTEYAAIRYSAGLMDVTPLFKYEVKGVDADKFLNRIMTKNIEKMQTGQVTYCCWTDDFGKVLDDGTVTRLAPDHFRVTAAEPSQFWFNKFKGPYQVTIEESTDNIAALSLQGPKSRSILNDVASDDISPLKFFRAMETSIDKVPVTITRTGYTGDLGYEVWAANHQALKVYDAIFEAGEQHALAPIGLNALDITRIEAGFIMNGVDYFSANHCMIDARKSTPYEIGLGWTVNLKDRAPFIGHKALKEEKKRGPKWSMVGLVLDWQDQENIFARYDLPPQICNHAWREGVPLYGPTGKHIGQATSGTWSPILKQNLALASVYSEYAQVGTEINMEYTVEYHRHTVKAVVTKTPFFNPERKRQ